MPILLLLLLAAAAWPAETRFDLRPGSLDLVGDFQGVALGDGPDETHLYLPRREEQGLLLRWADGRARIVDLDLRGQAAGSEAAAAWADYDGDGDLDLLVTRYRQPNLLFRNDRDSKFVEVASQVGLADAGASQGATWADFDRDGDLDLYVVRHGEPDRLFRNTLGSFEDVAPQLHVDDDGPGVSAAWADYDADGDLDLYLVHDGQPNRLFRNDGDQGFVDAADSLGVADNGPGVSCAWVDYDLDGDWDLSLTRYDAANRLFRNDRAGGLFEDVAPALGLDDPGRGRMTLWADFDRDGDLDALLVNGGVDAPDVNRLFRNDGGRFASVAPNVGLVDPGRGSARSARGAVWWDYDADGDLDLYVVHDRQPNNVFENKDTRARRDTHWLGLQLLTQDGGNRLGVGSQVWLWAGGKQQLRHVGLAENYMSQVGSRTYWGLGAVRADSVVIRWGDGLQQVERVRGDQWITLARATGRLAVDPAQLAFGAVPLDSSAIDTLYLTNGGRADLTVNSVSAVLPGGLAARMTTDFPADTAIILAPDTRYPVAVTITPRAIGVCAGILAVQSSVDTIEVQVTGEGVSKEPLAVSVVVPRDVAPLSPYRSAAPEQSLHNEAGKAPNVGTYTAGGAVLAGAFLWWRSDHRMADSYGKYRQSMIPEKAREYWDDIKAARTQRSVGRMVTVGGAAYLGYRAYRLLRPASRLTAGPNAPPATRWCWEATADHATFYLARSW